MPKLQLLLTMTEGKWTHVSWPKDDYVTYENGVFININRSTVNIFRLLEIKQLDGFRPWIEPVKEVELYQWIVEVRVGNSSYIEKTPFAVNEKIAREAYFKRNNYGVYRVIQRDDSSKITVPTN